jgi:hypothetical protein
MESAGKMPKYHSPSVKQVERIVAPVDEVSFVRLANHIDAKVKVQSRYSGREYLFDGAGSVVNVDERDVEWMLEKRQGERQCCGGTGGGNVVFKLAEE